MVLFKPSKDECSDKSHTCDENSICRNRKGSFECTCKTGYVGDGQFCEDIDECSDDLHFCVANSDCKNTPGSFECVCSEGGSLLIQFL